MTTRTATLPAPVSRNRWSATRPAGPVFLPAAEVRRRTAAVEIVVPVHNEEAALVPSVQRLEAYLEDRFPLPWLITVADNASTDATWGQACRLAAEIDGVQALRLPDKGRGRALRAAWLQSPAPVVAYMDVDLSTDLDALLPLVAPLLSGHSDLAIGTRLASGARVVRGPKREAISRTYNLILRTALRTGFTDAQCGFKAIRTDVARALVPLVEDDGWFFDTELLVLAEHNHLRIHEVPVDWVDDPDSRVDVVETATADLRGVGRMLRRFAADQGSIDGAHLPEDGAVPDRLASQLVRFGFVGAASSVAFFALFAILAPLVGPVAADVTALGLCAVANTAAHRRLTFARRGRTGRRHLLGSALLTAVPLVLNLAALLVASWAGVSSVLGLALVLTGVNALAGAGRFVVLRRLFS